MGIFRPQQDPVTSLTRLWAGAPFIFHGTEPAQPLEEFIAKGSLQPREILPLRRPIAATMNLVPPPLAESLPLGVALAHLYTPTDKIAAFNGQRQMSATSIRVRSAKWTRPFA